MGAPWTFDITVYDDEPEADEFPKRQAKYLVHSADDVLWTDDLPSALAFIQADIERLEAQVS